VYLRNVALTNYYEDDHIKGDEMGGACGACRRGEIYIGCWWGNLREITLKI